MNAEFETVRSIFFPRWDKEHKWTMKEAHPECVGLGLCDDMGKRIIVRDKSQVTLIHEIVHAVAASNHSKSGRAAWKKRL